MICPHCQANLKYKERSGRRCRQCRQHFALEPKANALKLSDRAFRRLTDRLSQQGTLHYTPQQLCYALNRRLLARPSGSTVVLSLGCAIQSLVAAAAAAFMVSLLARQASLGLTFGLLVAIALLSITWLRHRRTSRQRHQPTLRLTLSQCHTDFLSPWQRTYGQPPAGLVSGPPPPAPVEDQPDRLRAVLICPDRAIRDCLRANNLAERHALAFLPEQSPFSPRETVLLAQLKERPDLPLLLLHDASLAGCLLRSHVRAQLGLTAGHRLIDIGLHPATAQRRQLMQLWQPPQPDNAQQLTSATVQPPLSAEDRRWLTDGYYSPLLGLPPAALLNLVERGLARLSASRPVADQIRRAADQAAEPVTAGAEQRARAVGFLSWPEAS